MSYSDLQVSTFHSLFFTPSSSVPGSSPRHVASCACHRCAVCASNILTFFSACWEGRLPGVDRVPGGTSAPEGPGSWGDVCPRGTGFPEGRLPERDRVPGGTSAQEGPGAWGDVCLRGTGVPGGTWRPVRVTGVCGLSLEHLTFSALGSHPGGTSSTQSIEPA